MNGVKSLFVYIFAALIEKKVEYSGKESDIIYQSIKLYLFFFHQKRWIVHTGKSLQYVLNVQLLSFDRNKKETSFTYYV